MKMRFKKERFIWTVAVSFTLLWHALIWMNVPEAAEDFEQARAPHKPTMQYLPPAHSLAGQRARGDLMMPVLFSLPSAMGFSLPLHSRSEGLLEDSRDTDGEPAFLHRPTALSDRGLIRWPRRMDAQVAQFLSDPDLSIARTALRRPQARDGTRRRIRSFMEGPLAEHQLLAGAVRVPDDILREKVRWSATAKVEFDSDGLARHVFLVEPTDVPELNSAIVRSLYSWSIAPTGASIYGRVILIYD